MKKPNVLIGSIKWTDNVTTRPSTQGGQVKRHTLIGRSSGGSGSSTPFELIKKRLSMNSKGTIMESSKPEDYS
jgi:hypothetical protein